MLKRKKETGTDPERWERRRYSRAPGLGDGLGGRSLDGDLDMHSRPCIQDVRNQVDLDCMKRAEDPRGRKDNPMAVDDFHKDQERRVFGSDVVVVVVVAVRADQMATGLEVMRHSRRIVGEVALGDFYKLLIT